MRHGMPAIKINKLNSIIELLLLSLAVQEMSKD